MAIPHAKQATTATIEHEGAERKIGRGRGRRPKELGRLLAMLIAIANTAVKARKGGTEGGRGRGSPTHNIVTEEETAARWGAGKKTRHIVERLEV